MKDLEFIHGELEGAGTEIGPPKQRHIETETFRVLEGRYLFEVDGERFHAGVEDVVAVPGGLAHAFVNGSSLPACQFIVITPGFDAAAFFTGLGELMHDGQVDSAALNEFGRQWNMEFLGPPLHV